MRKKSGNLSTKKKTLTEHASFRINASTLDGLKKISKEQKISLNTYVNQIFDSHLSWDLHAPEVGWVVMLKSALQEIIKNLDNESIIIAAKNAAESGAKEIALSMRGKYNMDEWISILKDRAKSSGFSIKEYDDNGTIRLVMHHDMGENWSLFFETYYQSVFFDLGSNIKSEHTENSILLEIKGRI
jgi:hypothetical protein